MDIHGHPEIALDIHGPSKEQKRCACVLGFYPQNARSQKHEQNVTRKCNASPVMQRFNIARVQETHEGSSIPLN